MTCEETTPYSSIFEASTPLPVAAPPYPETEQRETICVQSMSAIIPTIPLRISCFKPQLNFLQLPISLLKNPTIHLPTNTITKSQIYSISSTNEEGPSSEEIVEVEELNVPAHWLLPSTASQVYSFLIHYPIQYLQCVYVYRKQSG